MNTTEIAKKLREEAARLMHAADFLEGKIKSFNRAADQDSPEIAAESQERTKTRADQIKEIVLKQGSARAGDIIAMGIPRGTVSTYLSPKYGYRLGDDGRWVYQGK